MCFFSYSGSNFTLILVGDIITVVVALCASVTCWLVFSKLLILSLNVEFDFLLLAFTLFLLGELY